MYIVKTYIPNMTFKRNNLFTRQLRQMRDFVLIFGPCFLIMASDVSVKDGITSYTKGQPNKATFNWNCLYITRHLDS